MNAIQTSFQRLYLDVIQEEERVRRFLHSDSILHNHTLFLSEEPEIIEHTYFQNLYGTALSYRTVSDTVSLDGDQTEIEYLVAIREDTGGSEHLCFDMQCVSRSKLIYFLEAVVEPLLRTTDIQTFIGHNPGQTHRIVVFRNLDHVFVPGTDSKSRRKILFYLERYIATTFFFFSVSDTTKNRLADFTASCFVFLVPRILHIGPKEERWFLQQFRITVQLGTRIPHNYTLRQFVRSLVHPEYDGPARTLLTALLDRDTKPATKYNDMRSFAIQWITEGRTVRELEGILTDWVFANRERIPADLSKILSQMAHADHLLVRGKKLIFHIEHLFSILIEAIHRPSGPSLPPPCIVADEWEPNEE